MLSKRDECNFMKWNKREKLEGARFVEEGRKPCSLVLILHWHGDYLFVIDL